MYWTEIYRPKSLEQMIGNEEIRITYKGPKEEPPPPKLDITDPYPIKFSPFNYFCLLIRKLAAERREYEMNMDDLPMLIMTILENNALCLARGIKQ